MLTNYRQACLENERLTQSIAQLTQEAKDTYAQLQVLEKELYGTQLRLREVEQREQSCIQEIHTLERHIDHLTHQYELA